ncbi:ankyrin repeat-containing domain protein [Coprinopsis sp. MPI-PUGE-AT-0042]|nr:ankyrin repeat-containing domain protein [Coprinopsis sp. MPI-PUGE-AT-0042]
MGTGIPGAGKTVLASIVIRELEALAAVEGSRICVCYVYIRYNDCGDLSVRNILEILVKQTVERHPDCASIADNTYARHIREKTQPAETELLQLLCQFTTVTAATFYLLDALDEAPDRIQVDLVLKLASLNVRLFITSRPLESVQARVPNAHRFPIFARDDDLDLHINEEISRSRDLASLLENADPSLRDEIVSLVKSKCGGMFLHASLQLDALCECTTAHEVWRTLEEFPSNIQDVYLQTWDRILKQRPSHVLLAKTVLVWVLNSLGPITIQELERAVATSPKTYRFEANRLAPGKTLMALCRGLVTLEEESRLVRLVHYTAKDTLEKLLHGSFPHPHSHLSTVCMTHLTQCGFQNTTINSEEDFIAARQADPLLANASDAWFFHTHASLDMGDMRWQIASFIRQSHAFPAFTETNLINGFDILSSLHMLAMYHLPLSLISQSDMGRLNVVTQICQESPLTLASWHGHEGAVASLLAYPEILVNLVSSTGWSALMAAARCGYDGIVKLLLAHPEIQINLLNKSEESALMIASKNGHESVVTLLLAHPEIQINLVNFLEESALMLAAGNDHAAIVKILLAHPEIQINLVNFTKESAIIAAARLGHESVVKLLLQRTDIQVNLVDDSGYSALMLAARYSRDAIARLLLDVPHIKTTTKNIAGHTAMSIALAKGHTGIVQLLQEFQSLCEEDQEEEEEGPVNENMSDLDDSDCYEDAEEWLEEG